MRTAHFSAFAHGTVKIHVAALFGKFGVRRRSAVAVAGAQFFAGEHCEGSDTSAATFRNCPEDRLQDSLLGSTEHAEVNGSRQVDRLLSHGRPARQCAGASRRGRR